MKVELLVNLKIGSGRVISAGSIFSDALTPIPDCIMRRLKRGQARTVAEPKSLSVPLTPLIPLAEIPPKKESKAKKEPKAKKLLKKKVEPAIS